MIGGEEGEVGRAAGGEGGEFGEDEMGVGVGRVAGLDGLEIEERAAAGVAIGEERGGGETGGD